MLTSVWSSFADFRSVATTGVPRRARNAAAPVPDRARPTTTTGFPSKPTGSSPSLSRLGHGGHRSFNVVSEKRAKTTATIQKRMMICGSFQPTSSK